MDKKRLEDMAIGDVLCDMHYGLRTDCLKNAGVNATLVHFPAIDGHTFLDRQLPHDYLNKMLVLVGEPDQVGDYVRAVFAYSYDGCRFGVVQIMAEPCAA